jgi:hypothetical protein
MILCFGRQSKEMVRVLLNTLQNPQFRGALPLPR